MKSILRTFAVAVFAVSALAAVAQHKITMGGMSFSPIFTLLHRSEVQKELGLSAAQKKQIAAAAGEAVQTEGDRIQLTITGDMDMNEIEAASIKALDAKQKTRLFEIYCQMQGMSALSHPSIADWIGLSDKTRKKLDAVAEEQQQSIMELAISNGGRIEMREDSGEFGKIRKKTEAKIKSLLTPAELKAWESKQGKKFGLRG